MTESLLSRSAWAAGTDKPELETVSVGFIPLTDCASIVVAAHKGFDRKYGLQMLPCRQASWAGVRDKLLNGELQASHALYGMVYGVHLGIAGPRRDMAILMGLNHNGQGVTLSKSLLEEGIRDGESLARRVGERQRSFLFAQTFPTGTHAMWLYYWLAAHGIHPMRDVKTMVVPPHQMAEGLRHGDMDGFCAGEPWNGRAVKDGSGFTVATSQEIWNAHPEKVLATTADFARQYPNTARAMMCALLEAARWIDASDENRREAAQLIGSTIYVNCSDVTERMMGDYEDGLGRRWHDAQRLSFFGDGEVAFPWLSDGMWFLTQLRRWGLLKQDVDYRAVAESVHQLALYRDAAAATGVAVPDGVLRSSRLIDGVVWDGREPAAYAAGFDLSA